MKKVGEYIWQQLSMWDFAPRPCIQKFVKQDQYIFHYYLVRVVSSEGNRYKTKTVVDLSTVPAEVLNWRGDNFSVVGE